MELLCVDQSADGLTVAYIEFKTVAFIEQSLLSLLPISSLFTMHDKDFQINLPKEIWKVNDYSLAVYGLVMFASTNLH
jgi:hypothetical protein